MLFSSFPFIFGFLPLALLLTYGVGRWSRPAAKLVLTLLSLGFYAWWRPIYLPLLLGSILFNYAAGARIQRAFAARRSRAVTRWLVFGLVVDVSLLGWFKYANFFADNLHMLFGGFDLPRILLPLAISFFTFQKIAYLVDSAQGNAKRMSLLDFGLFASFFPQLIAGPIVHYKEMVPQIQAPLFRALDTAQRDGRSRDLCDRAGQESGHRGYVRAAGRSAVCRGCQGRHAGIRRRLGGRADLHAAALFRLFRLFRHGDRACSDAGDQAAAELPFAAAGRCHHRILAALAHDPAALPHRLCLPADRVAAQPARRA